MLSKENKNEIGEIFAHQSGILFEDLRDLVKASRELTELKMEKGFAEIRENQDVHTEKINELINDVSELKEDMSEVKDILHTKADRITI